MIKPLHELLSTFDSRGDKRGGSAVPDSEQWRRTVIQEKKRNEGLYLRIKEMKRMRNRV